MSELPRMVDAAADNVSEASPAERAAVQGPRIGLALSGGGFRAAAFHLGVLKRLEELGVLPRIVALSTVSGGSITGALYALRCAQRDGAPGAYPVDTLIDEMRPFLLNNLRARALFSTPARALRTARSVVSRRISRIGLMVDELDAQLFQRATLNTLPAWISINATNLRTGKGWRFFNDRAGDYLAGATDRTNTIRVAEAVAASAAYPGLTDSYAFTTRWEHMQGNLLDEGRWARPAADRPGEVSAWRKRYGKKEGLVVFPLVDGGLYDNEGMNALRGYEITHAVISAVAPPASDTAGGFTPSRYLRIVEVVHDRLGNATRQLTHELTHGVHPNTAAKGLVAIGASLRGIAADAAIPAAVRDHLLEHATEAEALAAVGVPPRSHQFTACAQVLLHQMELAKDRFQSDAWGGVSVPAAYRGLDTALVAELSRVRTDLDALEPVVLDLLIAQGYFLADAVTKLAMPDVLYPDEKLPNRYAPSRTPEWSFAHAAVQAANANETALCTQLKAASKRAMLLGRVPDVQQRRRYLVNLGLVFGPAVALLVTLLGCMLYGAWRLLRWGFGALTALIA